MLYAVDGVAAVEVSVLAEKQCKMSDITEMHLIAGAVQTATTRVVYVHSCFLAFIVWLLTAEAWVM